MTKIRKQKRRKHFNHGKNRKRLKGEKVQTINCKTVKSVWNSRKSSRKNMRRMGLVFDVNKDDLGSEVKVATEVVAALSAEASAPRVKGYRMPDATVARLSELMEKYGEDYKAMARDPGNHLQHTWRQIRAKIKAFKNIPEQFHPSPATTE